MTTDSLLYPGVLDFCKKLYSENIRSPHLLAFMVDCYDELLSTDYKDKESLLNEALQVKYSPILKYASLYDRL